MDKLAGRCVETGERKTKNRNFCLKNPPSSRKIKAQGQTASQKHPSHPLATKTEKRNRFMSPAVLEEKIAGISPKYKGELVAFIDYLLFKQAEESESGKRLESGAVSRKLGGYEKGYSMAADFDAPLADFAEYT